MPETAYAGDIRPTIRVTDFKQIVDTLAVAGVAVLVISFTHATWRLRILTAIFELVSLMTSYILHSRDVDEEDEREWRWFRITNATLLTLKTAGLPEDVQAALTPFAGAPAGQERAFERLVLQAVGVARAREWMPLILLYSETLPESADTENSGAGISNTHESPAAEFAVRVRQTGQ